MTGKEKVVNFAFQIARPFTATEVASRCSVNYNTTKRHLLSLRRSGKIKVMCKKGNENILIWCDKPVEMKPKYGWTPNRQKLTMILSALDKKPLRLCDLYRNCDFASDKTIERYILILVSLGNIKRDHRGYYHLLKRDLPSKLVDYDTLISNRPINENIHEYSLKKPEEYRRMQKICNEPKRASELFRSGFNFAMVQRAVDRGYIVKEGNMYKTKGE